ncbi:MAG: hypothetical protein ABIG61_17680 [Planctomycetota bacterium]
MGKAKRLRNKRKREGSRKGNLTDFSQLLTKNFQKELKGSELWDQMVEEFGEKRAEEILRECKAEIKPGGLPDESGDRTKDFS